jgi:hypothetical protein
MQPVNRPPQGGPQEKQPGSGGGLDRRGSPIYCSFYGNYSERRNVCGWYTEHHTVPTEELLCPSQTVTSSSELTVGVGNAMLLSPFSQGGQYPAVECK